jgi:uncharacterized surface anchored protein
VTFDIGVGDTLDCTYNNRLQQGAIQVTKTRKHAATPLNDAHEGVTFTVTGGDIPAPGIAVVTDADGVACFDGLDFATYTVTETVPAGYVSDDATKSATVNNNADCDDSPFGGETVTFHNTPLTDVTVSVDSQVDGGTSSVIDCGGTNTTTTDPDAPDNGDGSVTVTDLEPTAPGVTLTCTITVDR